MPVKKSTRAKAPQRAKQSPATVAPAPGAPARIDASTDSSRMMGAVAVLLVFCVMAAAMLLAARDSSSPASVAGAEATSAAVVAPPDGDRPAAPAPSARISTGMPAAATKSSVKSAFVTISGCLERADNSFRLTDTDGSDAPRSRSWKSGFLKKGPAAIGIVDPTNRARLATHVGQRVSVTGTLEDRAMQVRSLRRIAPACN